jgi:hypothetical protein
VTVGLLGQPNTSWEDWAMDEARVRNKRYANEQAISYGKNYAGATLGADKWSKERVGAVPVCGDDEDGDDE